jgi:hypothetical protein
LKLSRPLFVNDKRDSALLESVRSNNEEINMENIDTNSNKRGNLMEIIRIKYIIGLIALFGVALVAPNLTTVARAAQNGVDEIQSPNLPAGCGTLQIPAGNKASFHVYAIGVQIYRWDGTNWNFVAPVANLYADAGFNGKVGIHYAGPTWESNSGSRVAAKRLDGCTPDSNAIPWLKLQTVSTEKPGIFGKVTYIQRVNTTGGLTPALPGFFVGEEKRVPYTAEYFFYRAED